MTGLFEKKHKLLFSFGSNTVKIRGFVEPAQRKHACAPVSVVDLPDLTSGQRWQSGQIFGFLKRLLEW
jgi:hypothetical protein